MKLTAVILTAFAGEAGAFAPSSGVAFKRCVQLGANIRGPTEKAKELRFGTWVCFRRIGMLTNLSLFGIPS